MTAVNRPTSSIDSARDPHARADGRLRWHPVDYGDAPWQRLLAFALAHADHFECVVPYRVVRLDLLRAPLWPPTLEAYRDDLVSRHASVIRGETTQDSPVEYLRFRMSPLVRRFVGRTRRLEDWSWSHGRPEDPAFLRGELPLLLTNSQHGRVTVFATEAERADLADGGLRLVEPLAARAEPWPTP